MSRIRPNKPDQQERTQAQRDCAIQNLKACCAYRAGTGCTSHAAASRCTQLLVLSVAVQQEAAFVKFLLLFAKCHIVDTASNLPTIPLVLLVTRKYNAQDQPVGSAYGERSI